MGVEFSRRDLRNSYDVTIPQVMNNVFPLKFHLVHGENIHLSKNGAVASRDTGFCKGIAFSHRPVQVNEHVYIKFLSISTSWSGALRIGFTANDPAVYKNKLPKYACPCLTDLPGNWARALAERCAVEDSVLFYYVDQNGNVHYGFNNEERGIFFGDVNTSGKLWALLDIYGNTVKIEFLDPRLRNMGCGHQELTNERTTVEMPNRNMGPHSSKKVILAPLLFHASHGRNVLLHWNRSVACRKIAGIPAHGYAFTERPVSVNEFIVIKVLISDANYEGGLIIGLTSCNPSALGSDDLPGDPDDLLDRSEYWVTQVDNEACKYEDIFVYGIQSNGAVTCSKNGSGLSPIMYVDHTLDLWFFVNLNGSAIEIRLEGTYTKVSEHEDVTPLIEALKPERGALSVVMPPLESNKIPDRVPESNMQANSGECAVCYEVGTRCALYPCGHVSLCHECAVKLKDSDAHCPICRRKILDVLKLYA